MVEIVPAILSKSLADYHRKFKAVERLTEWIQIDIVDNKFAPNSTIGPKEVASFRTSVNLEIQLMVEFVEDWIDRFIKLRVGRLVLPLESCRDPFGTISHVKRHGVPIGFSLNPETPTKRLIHYIDKLDTVLLLSVHPGFSGQHFIFDTLEKIRELRKMRPDITIEVDGGIEPGTARKCAEVGANILIAGSSIFDNATIKGKSYNEKVKNAIEGLKSSVEGIAPVL